MPTFLLGMFLTIGSGPPPMPPNTTDPVQKEEDWFEHERHAWISGGLLGATEDGSGGIGGELSLTYWPAGMGVGQWGSYIENLADGGWGLGLWAQGEYLLDGLHRGRYGAGLEFLLEFLGVEVGAAMVDPDETHGRTVFLQLTPFFSVTGIFSVGGRFSFPLVSLDATRAAQPFEVGAVFTLKLPLALDEGKEVPPVGPQDSLRTR